MRVLGEDTVMDWSALGHAPTPAAFQAEFRRMVERVRATVVDLRRLLDWAETRPAVAPQRVALIGFSESVLQVGGAMASDPRVAAAILFMGGARPHEILANCYGPPEAVRREVGLRFGWTAEQFAAVLEPLVEPIDPAQLGSRVDAARVLIFEAELDDCVPRSRAGRVVGGHGPPRARQRADDARGSLPGADLPAREPHAAPRRRVPGARTAIVWSARGKANTERDPRGTTGQTVSAAQRSDDEVNS